MARCRGTRTPDRRGHESTNNKELAMTIDGPIPRAGRSGNDRPRPSELLTVGDAASRMGAPARFFRRLLAGRRDDVPESHAAGPDTVTRAAATAVRSVGGSGHDC
jgi:hypothetical protein